MKSLAKALLAAWCRRRLRGRFKELRIGRDSEVYFWRVQARQGGTLCVGEHSRLETVLTIEREGACLTVGDRSFIGQGQISCASRIDVGDDVMIAWGTSIFDHASHSVRFSHRARDVQDWLDGRKNWDVVETAPVRVGHKAWIGFGCIVLPGVTIGEGAVVGAGSVVTRDVPPWTVAAGNPARTIREIAEDER